MSPGGGSLGEVGDQLAAGLAVDVVMPVGAGRRRFLQRLLMWVRGRELAKGLLLVVGRDDPVPLWQRDLSMTLAPETVTALDEDVCAAEAAVVVASGPALAVQLTELPPDRLLVVVDEPDQLDLDDTALARLAGDRGHLRLWLDQPHHQAPVGVSEADRDIGRLVAGLIDGELDRRTPQSPVRWAARMFGCAVAPLTR